MIFYTADLHFHYEPFLPSRPFDTVEDMDRQLIDRWNEAVSEDDTVYVVGDVGYNRGLVPGDALSRLRGHKHLIRGNHDTGFENAGELYRYFETVTDFNEIDDGDTHIILCHYPILYRKRGYMVHGHLHQTRGPEYDILRRLPRMLNAGVDVNFYRPVTLSHETTSACFFSDSVPVSAPGRLRQKAGLRPPGGGGDPCHHRLRRTAGGDPRRYPAGGSQRLHGPDDPDAHCL